MNMKIKIIQNILKGFIKDIITNVKLRTLS